MSLETVFTDDSTRQIDHEVLMAYTNTKLRFVSQKYINWGIIIGIPEAPSEN